MTFDLTTVENSLVVFRVMVRVPTNRLSLSAALLTVCFSSYASLALGSALLALLMMQAYIININGEPRDSEQSKARVV